MHFKSCLMMGVLGLLGLASSPMTFAAPVGPSPSPLNPPFTDTQSTPNIAPNSSQTFAFNEAAGTNPNSQGLFYRDFDDVFGGPNVKLVQYTLTGTLSLNGVPVTGSSFTSTTFTEQTNASGGYVGFLGQDPTGTITDNATGPTLVATISGSIVGPSDVGTTAAIPLGTIFADYSVTNPENTTFTINNTQSTYTLDPPIFTAFDPIGDPLILAPAESTPEPASFVMAATAGLTLAGYGWFRRKRAGCRQPT